MTLSYEDNRWQSMQNAMEARHSIRKYKDQPLTSENVEQLKDIISLCNDQSGLNIQLITDEPKAFGSILSKVMHFTNVKNYIALVGRKSDPDLAEKCGYYGEKLVLDAQMMGLNTCWVGGTYRKNLDSVILNGDEKLVLVIAIGYGDEPGKVHRSKPLEAFCKFESMGNSADSPVSLGTAPVWFRKGIIAATLAPTAMNQQKFRFILKKASDSTPSDDVPSTSDLTSEGSRESSSESYTVHAEAPLGAYTGIDLGIVKYHFEEGAGLESREFWNWA